MGYSNGSRVGTEWHSGSVGSPIYFGAATNVAPMFKAIATNIHARLGDDTGFVNIVCNSIITSNGMTFNGLGFLAPVVDGIIKLTNGAVTDFTRLDFGGVTAAFPAIARSGAGIAFKLADDSAFTFALALNLITNGAPISGGAGTVSIGGTVAATVGAAGGATALPATPLGYIQINVAGTAAKIPYYNN